MTAPKPRLHLLIWLLVAAALLYGVGFVVFAESLPRRPAKLDHPDAIVALTGGGARLNAAVALFEKGIGKRLLISGVNSTTTKAELRPLVHGGPRFDCCADLGFAAANTHGNAAEAAAWAKRHHYRRLVIVTASYHMPRSLAEFSAEMPGITLEPWPVEPDGIDLKDWWHDPHAIKLLTTEYTKYLASLVLTHVANDKERKALDRSVAHSEVPGPSRSGAS